MAQTKKRLVAAHLAYSWSSHMGPSTKRLGTGNPPGSLGKQMYRSYPNQHLHLELRRPVQSLLRPVKDFTLLVTRSKPCKERDLIFLIH